MKKIGLFFIFVFIASCQNDKLEFDTVYHYNIQISDDEYYELFDKAQLENETSILFQMLSENDINDLDATFQSVEKYYPNKKMLSSMYNSEIQEIYRGSFFSTDSKCIAIYRDFLVFKKNNSIVAISKICFDCDTQYTLKSNYKNIEINNERLVELKKIIE